VKFQIKPDLRDFMDGIRRLGTRAPIAVARAVNRTASAERTQAKRAIAADTGLRAKDVDAALKVENATPDRLKAFITVSGRRIRLIAFGARGPEPSRGRGRGVSYRLPKGRGRHAQAFIARMKSGHRGVFVRATPHRLPILELFGPSLPKSFETTYLGTAPERALATLTKNLRHEISYALKR
jgi:minor tail protein Z (GPZ)